MSKVPVSFLKCRVIEKNYFFIASKPDGLDEETEFTRLFFYDELEPISKWNRWDLPGFELADICVVREAIPGARYYAALSKEGLVAYNGAGKQWQEKVGEAGVKSRDVTPVYGYLNALKEIAGELYACGGGGQIYRRRENKWSDIAGHLRQGSPELQSALPLNQVELPEDFSDIDGYSDDDVYVAGMNGIYHFDGEKWGKCLAPTDEILTGILCAEGGWVWACGFNGTVLRGNKERGFEDVSHYDDNMILTSIAISDGKLYFSSKDGMYWLSSGAQGQKLSKLEEVSDCENLSSLGSVIIAVGAKEVMVYSEDMWINLVHPDNS